MSVIKEKYKKFNPAILEPSNDLRNSETELFYFMYGVKKSKIKYDILIHARSTNNYQTYYRNWPENNYLEIVKYFSQYIFISFCQMNNNQGFTHF